ncbi:MAG: 30S ribosomal protein S6 [Methyloligellaceae bacterium]
MPLYEHVFLARQDISSQQVESMVESFQAIITENGGSIAKSEYWGLKSLAYKIKKNRKAHYGLMNIDASHEAVAEMERQMRISSDIIRFMTLRVDEHDTEPSPIMRRGDRDDRRGGRRDRDGGHRGPRDGGHRGSRDGGPRESRDGGPRAPREEAPKVQAESTEAKPSEVEPSKVEPSETSPAEEQK